MTARDVGTLLTVRAVLRSMMSRMVYVRVIRLIGRGPTTLTSMMGAPQLCLLALPNPARRDVAR